MGHELTTEDQGKLFESQTRRLSEAHFLVMYWAAQGEDLECRYNITNCFDDMKRLGITRTKQTAVAIVEALAALCFIEVREESNRKNIFITTYGAKALEALVLSGRFAPQASGYLEEQAKK